MERKAGWTYLIVIPFAISAGRFVFRFQARRMESPQNDSTAKRILKRNVCIYSQLAIRVKAVTVDMRP